MPAGSIDAIVAEGLAVRGLPFQPEAEKTTLIRRVSFDLTELPPSLAEIDAFVAEAENFARLQAALETLQADRIAGPPFDLAALARRHAVHFRCRASGVVALRVNVMPRLQAMPDLASGGTIGRWLLDDKGVEYRLLGIAAVGDLGVQAEALRPPSGHLQKCRDHVRRSGSEAPSTPPPPPSQAAW